MDFTKKTNDEAISYIEELVQKTRSENSFGAKIALARIYSMAKSYQEEVLDKIEEAKKFLYKDNRVEDVIVIDESTMIVKCQERWDGDWKTYYRVIFNGKRLVEASATLDYALVLALSAKYHEEQCAPRMIYNMLNMEAAELANKLKE